MIKLTIYLIRNVKMSFDEFIDYHKEKNVQLFASMPVVKKNVRRFVISHTINAKIPGWPRIKYDGIVEFWFDNFLSMISGFINPKYLMKVRPDEKRFLNLKACDFIISRELPPIIY